MKSPMLSPEMKLKLMRNQQAPSRRTRADPVHWDVRAIAKPVRRPWQAVSDTAEPWLIRFAGRMPGGA
jgi:hypothetical protein